MLAVFAIIMVLVALLLPVLAMAKAKGKQVHCLSNLHQIGLAFRQFAGDHNDRFPMQVPLAEGGGKEAMFASAQFSALSRDLETRKVLTCPSEHVDVSKSRRLSYFVALDSKPQQSYAFLSGDRNIQNVGKLEDEILRLTPKDQPHWGPGLHSPSGNIVFVDGHAEEMLAAELRAALRLYGEYGYARK
jgi:prepilin-type processing-associated H-X9-DG protein